MGAVYLAEDPRLHRRVALKTITTRDTSQLRIDHAHLRAEARAAARLNHPNIASIYDVLETEHGPCIVMEYVEGETLATRLTHGAVSVGDAVQLGVHLADALAAAHAAGIVHRDIKPGNLQIMPDGVLKVLDLGIAKVPAPVAADTQSTTSATETYVRKGTPAYMAPEQLQMQPVGPYTDIYGAGLVLFEMLTGRRPFLSTDPVSRAVEMATHAPPSVRRLVPAVPETLDTIIQRALSLDPANRFRDGAELKRALAAVGQSVERAPAPRPPRVSTLSAAVAAVVLVAALVTGAWYMGALVRDGRPALPAAGLAPVTVAVMPVLNLSADDVTASVARRISELLVRNLAAVPNSTVLTGGIAEGARAKPRSSQPTLAVTDLSYVIETSIQRLEADVYRVEARLMRATGEQIFQYPFEGDLLSVQRDMLRALADGLARGGPSLRAEDRERLERLPTTNPDAFRDYLHGRAILEAPNPTARAEEAIQLLERAVTADSRFAVALASLSDAYRVMFQRTRDQQWLGKAIEPAERAIAVDATLAAAHYSLGMIRASTGQTEDAVRSLRTATALQPAHANAHRALGRILADRGNVDEGVTELQQALALQPDSWTTHYALAYVYYTVARYNEAIPHLRRVTELQPEYGPAYSTLGAIHHRLGELPQAIGYYEHAVRISRSADGLSNLGFVYYDAGRFEDALHAFLGAGELAPASAVFRRNAGDALARLGQRQRASTLYEQAVALSAKRVAANPRDREAIALMALCEAKLGRRREAIEHAAEAVVLQPDDRAVLYKQAAVYALLNEPQSAIDALRRAIDRGYERRLARDDDDLSSLHNLPEFRRLTAEPALDER